MVLINQFSFVDPFPRARHIYSIIVKIIIIVGFVPDHDIICCSRSMGNDDIDEHMKT